MNTEIIRLSVNAAGKYDEAEVAQAAETAARIWRMGGLVAFPTETVYGLGGNGLDPEAAKRIYAAKGRPSDNPLILHIAHTDQLEPLTTSVSGKARALMDAFWPGPLTLIFGRRECVPRETSGGLDTVAVRMPSHPVAARLLDVCGLPIAAPSANLSGRPSPTSAAHVEEDLGGRIDLIIDGGEVGIGVESTIIDVSTDTPVMLRPGYITREMAEEVIGPIDIDPAVIRPVSAAVRPKAPGMKYRHYAPKAAMQLVDGPLPSVVAYINKKIREEADPSSESGRLRIGVLATDETKERYDRSAVILSVGSRSDPDSIAHNLFRVLRDFDAAGVDRIYSETVPDEGSGYAVMNRLRKSAGYQIVRLPE